jgi:uncharacterized protein (DUF1330 family)
MPAYVVVTREKTRDAAALEQYKSSRRPASKNIQQSFGPFTARNEVLEGSAAEDIVILEFPTF